MDDSTIDFPPNTLYEPLCFEPICYPASGACIDSDYLADYPDGLVIFQSQTHHHPGLGRSNIEWLF